MTIDQRDNYVDKLRKKTGYVEQAAFRVSLKKVRPKEKLHIIWKVLFSAALLTITFKTGTYLLKVMSRY